VTVVFLTTPRLILRTLEESDLPGWANDVNSLRIVENTAAVPWPFKLDDARGYLRHAQAAGPRCLRAIVVSRAEPGTVIGGAIIEPDVVGAEAEIGYWIAERAWERGYGAELALALADHAFRGFGFDRLIASYCHGNEGSRRILVRLGFRHVRHSLERTPGLGAAIMVGHLELTRREWLYGMGCQKPKSPA
jgi:RimJ/RimL family protein N-acetyltransferase